MNSVSQSHHTNLDSLITITHFIYALQAVGIFFTPLLVVAVIVNYVKRDDVRGTFLESHFRWQIRTFWFAMAWLMVGLFTMVLLIGYVVLFVAAIWLIYRVAKGWLDLVDRKGMYRLVV